MIKTAPLCRGMRIGAQVKRKYSILGFALSLLMGLAFPLHGSAAETDGAGAADMNSIMLEQQDDKVEVSVSMSNAYEEGVTSLALALTVELEGGTADKISFHFSDGLADMVNGYRYDADTHKLNIYVASPQAGDLKPLFGSNNKLHLGTVQISASGQNGNLKAEIGYSADSFQTVNGAYGTKVPEMDSVTEPISLEVKNSGTDSGDKEEPGGDSGNQDPNGGQGGNQDSGQNGNQNQSGGQSGNNQENSGNNSSSGLNDETTRLVNDPDAAVTIPSYIIRDNGAGEGLADLSQGKKTTASPIKVKTASGEKNGAEDSKVTVIDPADGPDGILIAGNEEDSENGAAGSAENSGLAAAAGGQDSDSEGLAAGEEILLDKENGGVQGQKQQSVSGKHTVLIVVLVAAGLCIIVAAVFSLRGRNRKNSAGRKKSGRR